MVHKIAVIIPVHNAAEAIHALVESLLKHYPVPQNHIRFIFSDDASTDQNIFQLYNDNYFFRRTDVLLNYNEENLGYTKNINKAFRFTNIDEDIVFLNSDTVIAGCLFENLQNLSKEYPLVASITPLTNNGTIASLFAWPNGQAITPGVTCETVNSILQDVPSADLLIEIPTPVGFCFFVPRNVMNEVGLFDEEAFPKGYGEENDWAMRAAAKGYRHYLSLKQFVIHLSEQSFKEQKPSLLQLSAEKLKQLYPNYHEIISNYISQDSWSFFRLIATLRILKFKAMQTKTIIKVFVLHKNPNYHAGGVEVHVKNETLSAVDENNYCVQVYLKNNQLIVRTIMEPNNSILFSFRAKEELASLFEVLKVADELHVHHLIGFSHAMKMLIKTSIVPYKQITLHDYWSICPSVNLLNKGKVYCGLPSDLEDCNRCLKENYNFSEMSMARYRSEFAHLLESFNRVYTPSNAAKKILDFGFAATNKKVKIEVLPNPIPFELKTNASASKLKQFQNKIIFLGAFPVHKGAQLISQAAILLFKQNIEIEIWGLEGAIHSSIPLKKLNYRGTKDLELLRKGANGAIVCLPFVWPETFSYTLYEALHILQTPVVTGPFGHPAEVVRNYQLGVVMQQPTMTSLMIAIKKCTHDYEKWSKNVSAFNSETILQSASISIKPKNDLL